jgi:hypothetical protein
MACIEDTACYNFIFCKKAEPEVKVSDPRKLEITVIQSTLEEVKKTMSDSESDSGVGSVRTNDQSSENDSANENQQKKTVTLITPKLGPKPAKSSKPVKRSESVMSRFSFFFPAETEKLADMLVEEFKKNDQSNGLAMERMFRNQTKQSDKPEATGFNIFFVFSSVYPVPLFCVLVNRLNESITIFKWDKKVHFRRGTLFK